MRLRTLALLLIGFTATSSQILLLREFITTFHGNELVIGVYLAVWLLATALGSGPVAARLRFASAKRESDSVRSERALVSFAYVQFLAAVSLLVAIVVLLIPPSALTPATGEVAGLVSAFALSAVLLFPFCVFQGVLFPLGARLTNAPRLEASVSRVYLLEALGAAAGGLLFSLLLVHVLSSFQNVAALFVVNSLVAGLLLGQSGRIKAGVLLYVIAGVAGVVCVADPVTDWAAAKKWSPLEVVSVRETRYGTLACVSLDSQVSVYQDGLLLFTAGDLQSSEEVSHIPLLEHPRPQDVLLIGGGTSGVLREILKHRSVRKLDYVELDSELVSLCRDCLPREYVLPLTDPRVRLLVADGRRFLKSTSQVYDVIIMQTPPPYTAQANRFYTEEFFRLARNRLREGGVLAFAAPGVAEYVSDELAAFLGSLHVTSQAVFGRSIPIPVHRTLFVCTYKENLYPVAFPESLLSRLSVRGVETLIVRDYFLLSGLSPGRIAYFGERLLERQTPSLNRDLTPISFYYDLILWSAEYERFMKQPLQWILRNGWSLWSAALVSGGLLVGLGVSRRRKERSLLSAVAVSGFAGILLELEILLCFQILYGSLYDRVGILLTCYMLGLAVGNALERRREPSGRWLMLRPASIQFLTALFACCFLAIAAASVRNETSSLSVFLEWAFPAFAVLAGGLGGSLFSSVTRAIFTQGDHPHGDVSSTSPRNSVKDERAALPSSRRPGAGLTYAYDLIGSCVGALLCSTVIFPVAGLVSATFLLVIVVVGSGLGLLLCAYRERS